MIDGKLHELIDKLKQQGLESGEELARLKVEEARQEAEAILAKARLEAEAIVEGAKQDADRHMKRLQSSMEVAALKYVNQLKQRVESSLLKYPLKQAVDAELEQADFFKSLLTSFVQGYTETNPGESLRLRLPLSTPDDIVKAMVMLLKKSGQTGPEDTLVVRDSALSMGFVVDLKDGNVRLDFSEEAFLSQYLDLLTPEFRRYFTKIPVQAEDSK